MSVGFEALPQSLLAKGRDREAGRFLQWAKREVEAPWRKRRGGAGVVA